MTTIEVILPEALIEKLRASFMDGPIVDEAGRRFLTEKEVDRFNGLVVSIFFNEHPPPHFCVRYQAETANFSILDGERLPNNKGLEKFDRNIKKWWKEHHALLVATWNSTRPTDCSVGPIEN